MDSEQVTVTAPPATRHAPPATASGQLTVDSGQLTVTAPPATRHAPPATAMDSYQWTVNS
ncbi:MAG: hypothetical protein M5U34_32305 [Chloroflexi bacterium]|nr:hypothetical protein [Chloroflexota bacterium]